MSEQTKLDAAFLAGFIAGTYDLKGGEKLPVIIQQTIDRILDTIEQPREIHIPIKINEIVQTPKEVGERVKRKYTKKIDKLKDEYSTIVTPVRKE